MNREPTRYRKPLRVKAVKRLSDDQMDSVHRASMRLLADTGIRCAGEQAAMVYKAGGCEVTESGEGRNKSWQVRFPKQVMDKVLKTVPSQVILGARDPEQTLLLDAEEPAVYFGTGSETNVYLRSSVERFVHQGGSGKEIQYPVYTQESGSIAALAESARLIDQLENADFFIRNVNIQDPEINFSNKDVNVFFTSMMHTAKHVQGGLTDPEALSTVISMGRLLAGDQEHLPLSFIVCPIKSPLQMVDDSSEKVLAIAREQVPMVISSSPQGGSTAPIQEEGMVAQINAEILAGIALAQLASPGAPVIYGAVPVRARLDTLHDCYGAPEFIHYAMDCAQMARYYGIPCYASSGVGDAKRPGLQATMEKAYSYMGIASAGAQYIHYSFGLLQGTNIFSPLQAVLDNAAVALVKDILRPADCTEESVEAAADEVQTVSAGSGIFAKGIRKQLRKKKVAGTYEFISEGEDDQVFSQAQQKLDACLASPVNAPSEETIRKIYQQIPGLLDIQTYIGKGGSS